jgi:hypothetical protein
MFFWNKPKPTTTTIDPRVLSNVSSKKFLEALYESDKGFDKGCFAYKRSETSYGTDRVLVDGVEVLYKTSLSYEGSDYFRYTEVGLEMKEDLRDAISQLISSHQIFIQKKKNEDIAKARTAVRNYLDEDFFD